jgi:hypothetical protein
LADIDIAYTGAVKRIVWGADSSGRFRGREYFDSLDVGNKASFDHLFERLAETGQIRNREKFRQEASNLFVFKIFKERLACFFDGKDVVVIYGFKKKTTGDKRSARHLENAAKVRDTFLDSKGTT